MNALKRTDYKEIKLNPDNSLCFVIVRNEIKRIPFFLNYYREKGISKFFIVDNDSEDNTLDYLLQQEDVYVWYTEESFKKNKRIWLEWLLKNYGQNHWCLIVDADEILYYPDCETRSLSDFCRQIERQGKNAVQGIMLDMYSQQPVQEAYYNPGDDFLEVCPYFDRQYYHHQEGTIRDYYWGGLRQRIFGSDDKRGKKPYCLTKFPLLKYNDTMIFYSEHVTKNIKVSSTTACLLHFKYFSFFIDYVKSEIQRNQHWQGAAEYQKYAQLIAENKPLKLYDPEISVRLENSQQLIDMGIINRGVILEKRLGYVSLLLELFYDTKILGRAFLKVLSPKIASRRVMMIRKTY
ncbi:hypothetical protein MC7420_5746 [Coleofasciculus chthonoplastes PCC 7420]|uniref:Uncharacterized protein n=1 Tax=Coleofasciculus chthonoplastes PCC 7420 TaxID=118168 RepID=B4VVW8_9CYAN|nr:glycosyltransferase family 2 protein [Coleofasciculus chthonoplastes]EDX73866.1 hypothetical protein MC7420_5746 [Coleofasciculus chthonoplastes PCC 7420]